MISIRSPQQHGKALRFARKRLGLTQPQLALAAGVGVRFLVDLEVVVTLPLMRQFLHRRVDRRPVVADLGSRIVERRRG